MIFPVYKHLPFLGGKPQFNLLAYPKAVTSTMAKPSYPAHIVQPAKSSISGKRRALHHKEIYVIYESEKLDRINHM